MRRSVPRGGTPDSCGSVLVHAMGWRYYFLGLLRRSFRRLLSGCCWAGAGLLVSGGALVLVGVLPPRRPPRPCSRLPVLFGDWPEALVLAPAAPASPPRLWIIFPAVPPTPEKAPPMPLAARLKRASLFTCALGSPTVPISVTKSGNLAYGAFVGVPAGTRLIRLAIG